MPDEMMKMGLKDRIVLLNTLPKEGDIITIRSIRDLKMDIGLDDAEVERFNEIPPPDRDDLSKITGFEKDIPMNATRRGIIKQTLQDLEKQKKLHEAHIDLWDEFC